MKERISSVPVNMAEQVGSNPPAIILPKTEDVRELAKAATVYAVQCLVDIVADVQAPTASRIAAANALLDRAHGKTTDIAINNQITVQIVDFRKDASGDVITVNQ